MGMHILLGPNGENVILPLLNQCVSIPSRYRLGPLRLIRQAPGRRHETARLGVLNDQRLLGPIGDIPPVKFEQMYYQQQQSGLVEAGLN